MALAPPPQQRSRDASVEPPSKRHAAGAGPRPVAAAAAAATLARAPKAKLASLRRRTPGAKRLDPQWMGHEAFSRFSLQWRCGRIELAAMQLAGAAAPLQRPRREEHQHARVAVLLLLHEAGCVNAPVFEAWQQEHPEHEVGVVVGNGGGLLPIPDLHPILCAPEAQHGA